MAEGKPVPTWQWIVATLTFLLTLFPAMAARADILVLECIHQHSLEQIRVEEVHPEFRGTKMYYSVDLTARSVLHQDGTLLCPNATVTPDHISCKTTRTGKSTTSVDEFEIDRVSGWLVERFAIFGPKQSGEAHSPVDADVKHFWDCKKVTGRKF